MGRPSDYTPELANRICQEIMDGKSIRKICSPDDMPACSTVFKWLTDKKDFSEQYARAREIQAEILADEIVAIADDGENDTYQDAKGREHVDIDVIMRSRLRVDARKWVASKLLPKKYGDKLDINNNVTFAQLSDEELINKLKELRGSQ